MDLHAGEPSYTTGNTAHTEPAFTSSLGFYFVVVSLIIILAYGFYIYKRTMRMRSDQSPPLPPTTTTIDSDDDDYHLTRLCTGLDDDVLATFPTFSYSDVVMRESNTATRPENCASGCSVCLADYKPADVIRLLPECGHLFHVSCIDTWLKVHPTCPVCRNLPLLTPPDLTLLNV